MNKQIFLFLFFAILIPLHNKVSAIENHRVYNEPYLFKKVNTQSVENGKCGPDATWSLSDNGILTISGTGPMDDFLDSEAPWKEQMNEIVEIVIENGITHIGSWSFNINIDSENDNLKKVIIGDTVKTIGHCAFQNHKFLQEIVIPDSVREIGWMAFNFCENATITFGRGLEKVWEGAFLNVQLGSNFSIPDGVKEFGWNSFYSDSIRRVNIPASVEIILDPNFSNNLEEINVDEKSEFFSSETGVLFNKEKTELLCFPPKKNVIHYQIPKSVKTIGSHAFDFYSNFNDFYLTSIGISDKVQEINKNAFSFFENTKITIHGMANSVAETFFEGKDQFTFLADYNPAMESMIGFGECGEHATWRLLEDGTMIIDGYGPMDDYLYYFSKWYIAPPWVDNITNITHIIIGNEITHIGNCAFLNPLGGYSSTVEDKLVDIFIGVNVKSIGQTAFHGRNSINEIIIPDNVTEISSGIFEHCFNLDSITLSKNIKVINEFTFHDIMKLEKVFLPEGLEKIKENAFSLCENLKEIWIPASVNEISPYTFVIDSQYADKSILSIIVIHGVEGSYAEKYAKVNGIKFINDYSNMVDSSISHEPEEDKWICEVCSNINHGGKFCPECGAKRTEKLKCLVCGYELPEGVHPKFCQECGARIEQNETPEQLSETGHQTSVVPQNDILPTSVLPTNAPIVSEMVDPDLKAFLDSYESYVDKYIDLTRRYYANPTDMNLLIEYYSTLSELEEFSEAADRYDTKKSEMSVVDLSYFITVMARINDKLLSAYE